MMDWKEKALAATRQSMLGAVVACALGHETEPPCFHGKATVSSDGLVCCDFKDGAGNLHFGAAVGSLDDLERNVVGLSRHLDLVESERAAFAEVLVAWIGEEYCNARARLKSALTTAYPYHQTPTLH